MCKYLDSEGRFKGTLEVPDPYYGGAKGFELVRFDLASEQALMQYTTRGFTNP